MCVLSIFFVVSFSFGLISKEIPVLRVPHTCTNHPADMVRQPDVVVKHVICRFVYTTAQNTRHLHTSLPKHEPCEVLFSPCQLFLHALPPPNPPSLVHCFRTNDTVQLEQQASLEMLQSVMRETLESMGGSGHEVNPEDGEQEAKAAAAAALAMGSMCRAKSSSGTNDQTCGPGDGSSANGGGGGFGGGRVGSSGSGGTGGVGQQQQQQGLHARHSSHGRAVDAYYMRQQAAAAAVGGGGGGDGGGGGSGSGTGGHREHRVAY